MIALTCTCTFSVVLPPQALFFGAGWVFFMRKLFKNFEVCAIDN